MQPHNSNLFRPSAPQPQALNSICGLDQPELQNCSLMTSDWAALITYFFLKQVSLQNKAYLMF